MPNNSVRADLSAALDRLLDGASPAVSALPRDELIEALVDLLVLARAAHPEGWVDATTYATHALASVSEGERVLDVLRNVNAADLYLAHGCVAGHADAIRSFERSHISMVPSYVARIDPSAGFGDEVAQAVRVHLLLPREGRASRLANYAGRGPLAAWVRVCAARVAHGLRPKNRPTELDENTLVADSVHPEMRILKSRYGGIVGRAFAEALRTLSGDERSILKLHYLDALTITEVGAAYQVSRATAARMLARARERVLCDVRAILQRELSLDDDEAQSLISFARSQLNFSIRRHLEDE